MAGKAQGCALDFNVKDYGVDCQSSWHCNTVRLECSDNAISCRDPDGMLV